MKTATLLMECECTGMPQDIRDLFALRSPFCLITVLLQLTENDDSLSDRVSGTNLSCGTRKGP